MAKGLIGGMTDYSHQSFNDIIADLQDESRRTNEFVNGIEGHIEELKRSGYWQSTVPSDFKNTVAYSLKHYKTAITEFDEIVKDLKAEVKEHHIKRLHSISRVASEINRDIGIVWHQQYLRKDYGNADFMIVENVYGGTRDMAVNLLDISNIAERLKDYIGKTSKNMNKSNPWISGSFYLVLAVVVMTGLSVISNTVHWTLFPVVIIGGVLVVMIVGALQLRNDDKLSEKNFLELTKETYKRLPLLKHRKNDKKEE